MSWPEVQMFEASDGQEGKSIPETKTFKTALEGD
jgi:hypothetical protein